MHSKAMQLLYDEHDVILRAAERLQALLRTEDLTAQPARLEALLDFFRDYADGYHHRKEEDTLFAVLSNANPMLGSSIVEALTEHHQMFRDMLKEARAALAEGKGEPLRRLLGQYLANLRDHISAENDELFITAEEVLDDGEKEKLYFSFLDRDRELGTERKQQLEARITAES